MARPSHIGHAPGAVIELKGPLVPIARAANPANWRCRAATIGRTQRPGYSRCYSTRSGKGIVKATEKKSTRRSRTSEQRARPGQEPVAIPLLEFDASRVAIIEPVRIIKPIDISQFCVLCFFQEVIRELVSEGVKARQVHTGRSEAGDYPVYELDYGGRRLAVVSWGRRAGRGSAFRAHGSRWDVASSLPAAAPAR
jgi:hypothetical protein